MIWIQRTRRASDKNISEMCEQQVISVKLSEVNISINGINITFHLNRINIIHLRLYNGNILSPHNVEHQNFEPRAKTLSNLVTVIFNQVKKHQTRLYIVFDSFIYVWILRSIYKINSVPSFTASTTVRVIGNFLLTSPQKSASLEHNSAPDTPRKCQLPPHRRCQLLCLVGRRLVSRKNGASTFSWRLEFQILSPISIWSCLQAVAMVYALKAAFKFYRPSGFRKHAHGYVSCTSNLSRVVCLEI